MKKGYLLIILMLFISINTFSQVGINTETPNPKSILHISEQNKSSDPREKKGIIIPRLSETERNTISPGTSENSLMIYNTTEDCYNYWNQSEGEWKSLCGQLGKAQFTMDCSTIQVNGNYENGKELTNSNTIKVSVIVTKPGSYNIIGTTNNNNGYSFQASGNFLQNGTYTIYLIGAGNPINPTPSGGLGDAISIKYNENTLCTTNIFINDSTILPEFTINCQGTSVNGSYIVNQSLVSSNTITLNINSSTTSAGAPFNIHTETINGYSFKASGILNGGTQQVTLIGEGKPILNGNNTFTLLTNSTLGTSSCDLVVKVAARRIKILGLSNADDSYGIGRTGNLLNKVLLNNNYFYNNQSSTYPVNGFEFMQLSSLSSSNMTAVSTFNPDIVFIQYNYYANTVAEQTFLKTLLDKGTVVIYCTDGDGATATRNVAAKELANLVLNETEMAVTSTVDSDLMEIMNTGTVITSGPFMNLAGNSMGRDAGNNFGFTITGFPYDKASIIAYQDASRSSIRAFVSKINGFVFFGDGAPFAANTGTQAYNWPAKFKTTGAVTVAIPNTYGTVTSYNSFLFLNLIAWSIDYVQKNKQ